MDRVPSNHRLAERKLISLVDSGEWEIDDAGRIWRVAVRSESRGTVRTRPCQRRRAEKQLSSGYLMVRATIEGRRVVGLAHRLVWQHRHGDIEPGATINHKNGLKDDNRPGNLEPRSYGGNTAHAHRAGLRDQRGEKNPAAKLTDNQVAQIRNAYASDGFTMQQLADRFDVSVQHISRVIKGGRRASQLGPVSDVADLRHSVCDRDPATGRFVGRKADAA